MLKLKQYFCRHNFEHIAKHKCSQQNLWRCTKCGVFVIQHYGLDLSYKSQTPQLEGWIYEK
jgi:hypothetical protein